MKRRRFNRRRMLKAIVWQAYDRGHVDLEREFREMFKSWSATATGMAVKEGIQR